MPEADSNTRPAKHAWLDTVLSEDGPDEPLTRFVLTVFARWVSLDGQTAAVAQSRLIKQTALGKRTVQRHLRAAVNSGWLQPAGHYADPRGRFFTPRYRIAFPMGCQNDTPRQSDTPRDATETPQGVSETTRGGVTAAPYTQLPPTNTQERESPRARTHEDDDEIDWKDGIDREAADYLERVELDQDALGLSVAEVARVEGLRNHPDAAIREFACELLEKHREAEEDQTSGEYLEPEEP